MLWTVQLVIFLAGLSFVIAAANAAIRVVFAMGREEALPGSLARLSGRQTPVVAIGCLAVITLALGLPFTYAYGEQSRLWRHLLIPAAAVVVFLFPLWGIIRPPAYTLVNLLPITALGWLGLGVIAVVILRARRPARFETLGRAFMPAEEGEQHHDAGVAG